MKKTKFVKRFAPVLFASMLTLAGCNAGTVLKTGKFSDELLYFKSSDESLDIFLNDYFKRHSGYVDENGTDQKVNSVTAGVNAVQFFWQEWNSMSYYWFNSYDGYKTDRIKGIRKILSNIPVDDYGYVWQETDAVRGALSTPDQGEHRMGWPFPNASHTDSQAVSWDFNGDSTESAWTSSYSTDGVTHDNAAEVKNGLYTTDVEGVNSLAFTSNKYDSTVSYFSPLLEIDLRMYTADCENIEDILVHYTASDTGKDVWNTVSVKEKAFISYEFTPSYEHLIFLPMYAEENWKSNYEFAPDGTYEGNYIKQIRIEIKAKEGTDFSGKFALNSVRPAFDTRHSNNNSIFISSLRNDYDYTGDIGYLKENITKARKAMNFYMQMYDKNRRLNDQSYLVGHEGDKTARDSVLRTATSLSNGYWDISFMPKFDFQSNMYFYKALVDLAYLEGILDAQGVSVDKGEATVKTADRNYNFGTSEYTYDEASLTELANGVLAELRKSTSADGTGFWDAETGRFVAGYAEKENKWYDYGYVMWNLEAIYYGIANETQAKSIMDWVSGARTVEKDKFGSQGEDIYYYEFAPRTNTYSEADQKDNSIFTGHYKNDDMVYGKTQVQNGGAIMYVSFFDLMARVNVYGANDAFSRLLSIKDWYMDIYDYYVQSENYGVSPDRFYWDYYQKSQWKGQYVPLQNGIKGAQERGGDSSGVLGIDGEFLESFLMVSAIPYGFFGMDTADGNTLKISPSLPDKLSYWGMENLSFNKVKYDLTIEKNSLKIDCVRGNATGLQVQVSLPTAKENPTVYVNGVQTNNYTVKDGKVTLLVPLAALTVEVK
ncbi:MAG: hypothetical protein IJ308_04760 [Clostridia bacterium]|nr:hypothetical protein [Clostridia bacterium]